MAWIMDHKLFGIAKISRHAVVLFCACFILCAALPAYSMSEESIENKLKSYLKNNYPWDEIELYDLKLSSKVSAAPKRIFIEKPPPGRTVFSIELEDGVRISATATVKAFDMVVVSRGAFRRGYTLQDGDVYVSFLDVSRIPRDTVKDMDAALGKKLTRSIIANAPIDATMLMNESQVVKKGQKVALVIESPYLSIMTMGMIKETGQVGNYVRAINIASNKIVTGLLMDENTVKVRF